MGGNELFDPEARPAGAPAIAALVDALSPLDARRIGLLRAAVHELRTPLTAVSGYVELLADRALGPISDEQERILRIVARNAQRLTTLVEALEPAAPAPARPAVRGTR
jgi:signal transduction histidine kinase